MGSSPRPFSGPAGRDILLAVAPLLLVGLPVYNGERFLAGALDSILAQDVAGLEIVVSDNASTDGTRDIGRRYAARDPRVRFLREETNRGPTWNFNRLLQHAREAPYFMWAGDDDFWAPDYASSCIRFLESHPEAVVCGTRAAILDREGRETGEIDIGGSTLGASAVGRAVGYLRLIEYNAVFYGVYRSRFLEGRRLENRIGNDIAFLMELALTGPFHVLPAVKFWRRMGGTSRSVAAIARTLDIPLRMPGPLARLEILSTLFAQVERMPALQEADRRRLYREVVYTTCRRHYTRRLMGFRRAAASPAS
jgi:glycosyltransferase involved in cell wall biosynthesis